MATIAKLIEERKLINIEVGLDGQPFRCIYGTPDFIKWLKTAQDIETKPEHSQQTAIEQIDDAFHEFIIGDNMDMDRRFKKLRWTPDYHIWELKTIDIRMFGWIPQKDHLILAFGDIADEIKLKKLYGAFIAKTKYAREQMNLNEPKCIEGMEYDNVLSDQN